MCITLICFAPGHHITGFFHRCPGVHRQGHLLHARWLPTGGLSTPTEQTTVVLDQHLGRTGYAGDVFSRLGRLGSFYEDGTRPRLSCTNPWITCVSIASTFWFQTPFSNTSHLQMCEISYVSCGSIWSMDSSKKWARPNWTSHKAIHTMLYYTWSRISQQNMDTHTYISYQLRSFSITLDLFHLHHGTKLGHRMLEVNWGRRTTAFTVSPSCRPTSPSVEVPESTSPDHRGSGKLFWGHAVETISLDVVEFLCT